MANNVKDLGTYDFVIVGAGSGGCVLANRLSADPSKKVLLIEAGKSDNHIWVHVPVGYLYAMGNPRLDWCLRTEAEPGLNGRALNYPRGKVLGGCSSINGMIYMRGQARDYDIWAQMGNPGWSWDDVLPYFKRSEKYHGGADMIHGGGGELRVEDQRVSWPILDAVQEAAEEMGIPCTTDFNGGDNEGAGYFEVTQRRGVRWNARKAFLTPAKGRTNLTILTEAEVDRITFDGTRATGLELRVKDRPARVKSGAEIVLAAGAIGTPKILELSGVGDAEMLRGLGIDVVANHPHVGANLADHLQIRTMFRISGAETLNDRYAKLSGKLGIAAEYLFKRSGPMAMAPSQMGIFARSSDLHETANIEYHVQPLSLEAFGQPLDDFPALTVSVVNLRPESRGTSHIKSSDPREAPAIKPNYLSSPSDRQVAVESIRHARALMATNRMAEFNPIEVKPGPQVQSEAELTKAAGDIATTIFHPVSTARMGAEGSAVVSPDLRVYGLTGLSIADASVMPAIPSGNTHAPVTMIAEKASDMIRARHS